MGNTINELELVAYNYKVYKLISFHVILTVQEEMTKWFLWEGSKVPKLWKEWTFQRYRVKLCKGLG